MEISLCLQATFTNTTYPLYVLVLLLFPWPYNNFFSLGQFWTNAIFFKQNFNEAFEYAIQYLVLGIERMSCKPQPDVRFYY
jgi:hypothetical protein